MSTESEDESKTGRFAAKLKRHKATFRFFDVLLRLKLRGTPTKRLDFWRLIRTFLEIK